MSDRIPLCKPSFGREESLALQETLESGWWGRGPRAIEFEESFAQYVGAEHAVALNSATAALHLALLVAEVGGQEVLTTSMTFVSTKVVPAGKDHAKVTGDLTLHGVTKPVTLDVTLVGAGVNPLSKKYTVGFEATGTLKRSEFGVKTYVPLIGDELHLTIAGAFEKQD